MASENNKLAGHLSSIRESLDYLLVRRDNSLCSAHYHP